MERVLFAILLVMIFDPEDGGDLVLREVCRLAVNYTALYSRG
jgi:hypothetical protein